MKKLVLFVLLIVLLTMTVNAAIINVPADHGTIQAAIDAAIAGDTIQVVAGTYTEQLQINKDLILEGGPGVILQSPVSRVTYTIPESGSTLDPIIFVFGGTEVAGVVSGTEIVDVEIRDIEIDGQDDFHSNRYYGILARNADVLVENCVVHNIGNDGIETFGIVVYGDSECVVQDNVISGFSRGGIGILGEGSTAPDPVCEVLGNTVTGPGDSDPTWAPNGIQVSYGASANIDGNEVSACGWPGTDWSGTCILGGDTSDVTINDNYVHDCEQAISAGDYPSSWGGIFAALTASNFVISNNRIEDNEWGISIFNDISNVDIFYNDILDSINDGIDVYNYNYGGDNSPTDVVIRFNNIVGNGPDAVWIGDSVAEVDARYNWWGTQDGPSGDGPGTGDNIVGNATFMEWLCEESMTLWISQNGVCTYPHGGGDVSLGLDFDLVLEGNLCPEIVAESEEYFINTWLDEVPSNFGLLPIGLGYEDLADIAFTAGWGGRSYAFDGELITFEFDATDADGEVDDCVQGYITLDCGIDPKVVQCLKTVSLNEETADPNDEIAHFTCEYYVEDAETANGECWLSFKIEDTCNECEDTTPGALSLYLNPAVGITYTPQESSEGFGFKYNVEGDILMRIVNGEVLTGPMPGDTAYTPYFAVENAADQQTGLYILLQLYGTDFRATNTDEVPPLCGTSNRLEIENMEYMARHENAEQDWTQIPDGTNLGPIEADYVFTDWVEPDFNGAANFLGVGDDITMRLRLHIPSPCQGEFTEGGEVMFVGTVI